MRKHKVKRIAAQNELNLQFAANVQTEHKLLNIMKLLIQKLKITNGRYQISSNEKFSMLDLE